MIDAKVGEFYKVPCLHMAVPFYGSHWVPVIGPKHKDEDLRFHWEHFHIDWRFASRRMLYGSMSPTLQSPHGTVISNNGPRFTGEITGEPELKRRKCRRSMPDWPASPKTIFQDFEAMQRKRCDRLKDGHTCPHRGIDLRPFERPDGTAICPGHGLHWDLRTGLLLARHQPKTNPQHQGTP